MSHQGDGSLYRAAGPSIDSLVREATIMLLLCLEKYSFNFHLGLQR